MHEIGTATARYLKAHSYKGRGNKRGGQTSRLSWVQKTDSSGRSVADLIADFGNFNPKSASCNLALRPNQHIAASAVSNPSGFACDARLDRGQLRCRSIAPLAGIPNVGIV